MPSVLFGGQIGWKVIVIHGNISITEDWDKVQEYLN